MKARRFAKSSLRPSAVVVGLLVVVALLGVLAWVRLVMPPSTADYRNAAVYTEEAKRQSGELDSVSGTYAQAIVASLRVKPDGSSLAADTEDERSTFDSARLAYADTIDMLDRSPANKDAAVRKAIRSVVKQADTLESTIGSTMDEYDDFYRTYGDCDAVSRFAPLADAKQTADAYEKTAKNCVQGLNKLKKAKTTAFKDYATELGDIVWQKQQAYEAIADQKPGDHAAILAKLDERLIKLDSLTTVQRIRQDIFTTTQLDDLTTVLKQKQRK